MNYPVMKKQQVWTDKGSNNTWDTWQDLAAKYAEERGLERMRSLSTELVQLEEKVIAERPRATLADGTPRYD